jgi:serine/threonine protein kinase
MFRCVGKHQTQRFVRKKLIYSSKAFRQRVHDKVNTMEALSHSHVARLCGCYFLQSEKSYAILMQPMAKTNLLAYLERCSREGYPESILEPILS